MQRDRASLLVASLWIWVPLSDRTGQESTLSTTRQFPVASLSKRTLLSPLPTFFLQPPSFTYVFRGHRSDGGNPHPAPLAVCPLAPFAWLHPVSYHSGRDGKSLLPNKPHSTYAQLHLSPFPSPVLLLATVSNPIQCAPKFPRQLKSFKTSTPSCLLSPQTPALSICWFYLPQSLLPSSHQAWHL